MWNGAGLWPSLFFIAGQIVVVLVLAFVLHWLIRIVLNFIASRVLAANIRDGLRTLQRTLRGLIVLIAAMLALAIAGFDGFLLYRGEQLLPYYQRQSQLIPPDFWVRLAIGLALVIVLSVLAAVCMRLVGRFLGTLCERIKGYEQIRANDESIEQFFDSLDRIQRNGLWLWVLALATVLVGLPAVVVDWAYAALHIYLFIAVGLLLVQATSAVVATLDALSRKFSRPDNWLRYYSDLQGLIPLLQRTLEYIIAVVVVTLVLLQIEALAPFAVWGARAAKVIGIVFLARVVIELSNLLVERAMSNAGDASLEERQRRQTLNPVIKSVLKYLVYFGAFVFVLSAIDIDPTPILAGAGILTFVVGFGAQPLVNDIVSGFFILFENYFLVGDYVIIGDATGIVEAIDVRTTRIRNSDGQLHILRNGQIGDITNFSKGYTHAIVVVGVAYDSDLAHVYSVIEEAGRTFATANADVLEATKVLGVDDFGASEVVVRTATKVRPGKHNPVSRALRRHIKMAFDEAGIEIPFTQQVIHFHPTGNADFLDQVAQKIQHGAAQ